MSDQVAILALGVLSAAAVTTPFLRRVRERERSARDARLEATTRGLHEPLTMYPVVDTSLCIGIGSCVSACPELDVLGMVDGQARAVRPAACVGHGLCEAACPTNAITLVYGTSERGVDLPRLKGNFETNVPGLYIVGELGGMGLIRNAFVQGRQCVAGIAAELDGGGAPGEMLDVIIVGCGPAGLAASLECLERGLRFETIEREDIGGALRHYPRKKLVMSEPVRIPGYGILSAREISKERLIEVWSDVVGRAGLPVRTGETVEDVARDAAGGMTVRTDRRVRRARRVILAIGRRGVPRKLGILGEDGPHVAYSLREPEAYRGDRILVIGGGDSAVEAALRLTEQPGNQVRISYRGSSFSRPTPSNVNDVLTAISRGSIGVHWGTTPVQIGPDSVALREECGRTVSVPADRVFVFVGGELPTDFLRSCGVAIDTVFGEARPT
ncbi:MAG: NAD(P)-binding domain-containing protein [Gemmatimonadota bacterium]|nr:NAD(P)-binding domain-containing protein [Gemmatimonadota bacterium]